jgi:hypothetical protein
VRRQEGRPAIKTAAAGISRAHAVDVVSGTRRHCTLSTVDSAAPSAPNPCLPALLESRRAAPSAGLAESSPEPSSRRMLPGRAVEPQYQHGPNPNQAPKSNLGESLVVSPHLPRPTPPPERPNSGEPRRPPCPGTTLHPFPSFQGDFREPGA